MRVRVRRHVARAMTCVALVVGMVGGTLIATTLPASAVPGTITQIAPTSGATTSAASGSFSAQLQTTGGTGSVNFHQSPGIPSIRVSLSGGVITTGTLSAGTYSASGTDEDSQGDHGTWSFNLTVTPSVTSHTIVQIAPITGTTTTDNSKTFTSQLQTTGGHGPVKFNQSTGVASLRVSSPGRVTTPGPLGVGTYTATGTDSDPPGPPSPPGPPGPGNQGDTGTWTFTLTVTSSGTNILQAAPTTGSTTTVDSTTFTSQLNTAGNIGAVTFVTTASNSHLVVSSSGAVSVVSDPLAAGSYTVSGTDHDGSSDTGTWTFTLTVTLASQTITFSALSAETYGTAPLALTATASSGLPVTYTDNSANTICTLSGSTVTIKGVGSCSITASQAGNAVYGAAPDTQAFTINPAPLIITASSTSVTYGAAIPTITPTYSGFVNTDSATNLTTAPTCTTNYTPASPAGTTPSTSCAGSVDANYSISYVTGTISISQASLTITAASGPQTYGGTPPTITPTYSGFVNGDTSASLSTQATCSSNTTSGSSTGTYASSCSGTVDSNYTITYVDGTVTVNAGADRTGTIVIGSPPASVIAGSTGITLVISYTSGTGGLNSGAITVVVPAGWSSPTTTSGGMGYTTSTCGTVGVSSQMITVSDVTLISGATCTITYGSTAKSSSGSTAQATSGTASFTAQEKSTSGGTLTSITAATLAVNAPFIPDEGPSVVSALPSGVPSTDLGAAVSSSASSTVPITDTVTSGTSSSAVMVPAGALPAGTTVSMYPITNTTSLEAQVPTGNSYVAAIAISWQAPNGTSPAATAPITLTITNPNIKAGDVIYKVTLAGLTNVGTAVVDGSVTITFTTDPVFMVTAKILVVQAALSVTSRSGTVGAALTLVTSGGSGTGTVSYTVVDGTASGCAISGGSLSVTSAGTCVVVATKAADGTYTSVSSTGTVVTLAKSASAKPSVATPAPVVVTFFYKRSLSNSSKNALTNLSRKLVRGASVTITGYALKDISLAKLRAKAVAAFLLRLKHVHVKIQIVTNRSIQKAKVITTKI